MYKLISKENFIIILIILISIFFSISYSYIQRAIEGGLVLSEIVKYPEAFSPMKAYYYNSWTFLHQFSAFFLKLNVSIVNTSRIIIFISTFFYFTGVYFVVRAISSSYLLAFFAAFTVVLFRKNFGDLDYPTIIFSIHSYGMMSLALTTFIFGLIANKNYFWASFFSIFLICIHPVVGLWVSSIFFISFYLSKKFLKQIGINKKIIFGSTVALLLISISYWFFNLSTIDKVSYNQDTYSNYLDIWETHRIYYGKAHVIHYEYLLKSVLLIFTCVLGLTYFKNIKPNENQLILTTILLSSVSSSLIYVFYKINPNLFPDFIVSIIPTRFAILHSVIGWPIILTFAYIFIKELFLRYNYKPIFALVIMLIILFSYTLSHYKNILIRSEQFIINIKNDPTKKESYNFWKKVKETEVSGFVLTSAMTAYPTMQKGFKPVLLFTDQIDFIPYHPYAVDHVKTIFEDIYKLPFDEIPKSTHISEDFIKNNFESKSYEEWNKIFEQFNIDSLIVPSNWDINLNIRFKSKEFTYYTF